MNLASIQPRHRAVAVLLVQAALVLSIGGKYLVERKTSPRVWVRTAQYDPNLPLRGRYLGLRLIVNACDLPREGMDYPQYMGPELHARWQVRIAAQDGKLVPIVADAKARPDQTQELAVWAPSSCDHAQLANPVDYYIPDTAKSPFPLQPGQELWVEVTVPPQGPPRPIQLALSQNGMWTLLKI